MKIKNLLILTIVIFVIGVTFFSNTQKVLAVAPTVTTEAASAVTSTTATFNGTITDNAGFTSLRGFNYGTSTDYGTTTSEYSTPGSSFSAEQYTKAITGLVCGTTYHYRAYASSDSTGYGTDQSFTTSACSVAPTVFIAVIHGDARVGQVLTGDYFYSNLDNNPEGASTYAWLRSMEGGAYSVIDGATNRTYTSTVDDLGKLIIFQVTPVTSIGPITGTPVASAPIEITNTTWDSSTSFIVNSSLDSGGGNNCNAGSNNCTLRGALLRVNALTDIPATISIAITGEIDPVNMLPILTHSCSNIPDTEAVNTEASTFCTTITGPTSNASDFIIDGKYTYHNTKSGGYDKEIGLEVTSDHNKISNLSVNGFNFEGFWFLGSSYNTVDNVIGSNNSTGELNKGDGLSLSTGSNYNTVQNSTFSGNSHLGLWVFSGCAFGENGNCGTPSEHNYIYNNHFTNNLHGGSTIFGSNHNHYYKNHSSGTNGDAPAGFWIIRGSDDNLFEENESDSDYIGLALGGTTNNIIRNNTFNASLTSGIAFQSSGYDPVNYNNLIEGNTISDSSLSGINLTSYASNNPNFSSYDNIIRNNTITGSGTNGITVQDEKTTDNILDGNTITGSSGNGIFIMNSTGNTFTGNIISNSTQSGISFNNVSNSTIGENEITASLERGILLFQSNGNTLNSNTVSASGNEGILLNDSDNNTVNENQVFNSAWQGLYLYGGSSNNTINLNKIYNNGTAGTTTYFANNSSNISYGGKSYNSGSYNLPTFDIDGSLKTFNAQGSANLSGLDGTKDLYLALVTTNQGSVTVYTTESESSTKTVLENNSFQNVVVDYYSTGKPIWLNHGSGEAYTWDASALPSGGQIITGNYIASMLAVNYNGHDYDSGTPVGAPINVVIYLGENFLTLGTAAATISFQDGTFINDITGTVDLDLVLFDASGQKLGIVTPNTISTVDLATALSGLRVTTNLDCRESSVFVHGGSSHSFTFKPFDTWSNETINGVRGCGGATIASGHTSPATLNYVASASSQELATSTKYSYSGISLDTATSNTFSHNTLYGNGNGIILTSTSTGNTVIDNIISSLGDVLDVSSNSSLTNTYNLLYSAQGSTKNYLNSATAGTGEISADPQFTSASTGDFSLLSTSPAIEKAHDGTDMGAVDYVGSTTPATHHSSGGGYLPGYGPNAVRPIVTPATPPANAPDISKITKTLKQGLKKDDQVKILQAYLNTVLKLKPPLVVDGNFGLKTKLAVIAFQKAHGLVPDGIVGPKTLRVMKDLKI